MCFRQTVTIGGRGAVTPWNCTFFDVSHTPWNCWLNASGACVCCAARAGTHRGKLLVLV